MSGKIIELIKEIRETKKLTMAVREEVLEVRALAEEAKRQADAAWVQVFIAQKEFNQSIWKKWFGLL
jgi:hypothetical protein